MVRHRAEVRRQKALNIEKRWLMVFVLAAYALSWWSIPVANGRIIPHGPFLAAVMMVAFIRGWGGVGEWFRRIINWRGEGYWLLMAPGLGLAYFLLALALNFLLGASISNTAHLNSFILTLLGLLVLGGQWEELGWSGYALPLLQGRYAQRPYSSLLASLHLGAIRMVWHLPLMISGAIPWYDGVFYSLAMQLLISWLYNRSGGNVLAVMLFHLTSNVVGGGLLIPLFNGPDQAHYYQLFIALAWLIVLLLVGSSRWGRGQARNA